MAQLIYSWSKSSLVFHLRSSRLQTFSIDFLRLRGNSLKILKYTHPFSLWNCLNALNLFIRLMRSPYWQVLGWQTRHQYKRLWFYVGDIGEPCRNSWANWDVIWPILAAQEITNPPTEWNFGGLLFGMPRLDVVNILNLIHKMAAAMRPLSTTTVATCLFSK